MLIAVVAALAIVLLSGCTTTHESGYYYLAMQTITGASSLPANPDLIWAIPADVIVLKLDGDFKVVEKKTIASDPGHTDAYVTGLKSGDRYFYVTYNKVRMGGGFSSVIGVFDRAGTRCFRTLTRAPRASQAEACVLR